MNFIVFSCYCLSFSCVDVPKHYDEGREKGREEGREEASVLGQGINGRTERTRHPKFALKSTHPASPLKRGARDDAKNILFFPWGGEQRVISFHHPPLTPRDKIRGGF